MDELLVELLDFIGKSLISGSSSVWDNSPKPGSPELAGLTVLDDFWVVLEDVFETPSPPGSRLFEELEELEELEDFEVERCPFFELVDGVLSPELLSVLLALLPSPEGMGSGIGSETDTPEFDWFDGGGETHPATKPAIPTANTYFLRLLVDPIKQAIE